jgi:tRNA 2-thiocytidine biosynthesis protein TtcA
MAMSLPLAPNSSHHGAAPRAPGASPSPISRVEQRLLKLLAQASHDHALVEAGDRILVAVSGGKDSHGLLHLLRETQRRAPFQFSLIAVNVDQGQPGFPAQVLPEYFEREGYEHHIITEDTYSVVTEKIPEGKTYCSLCSRLRRGILYTAAARLGANKIALGHHRDDAIVTLLLNIFYAGKIAAMPAKLSAKGGEHTVIRPLLYCPEEDLIELAKERAFPIIPCNLCGSQDNLKRRKMKELVAQLHAENPKVRGNLFAALGNVLPAHLLDRALLDSSKETESVDDEAASTDPSSKLIGISSLLRTTQE